MLQGGDNYAGFRNRLENEGKISRVQITRYFEAQPYETTIFPTLKSANARVAIKQLINKGAHTCP